MSAENQNFEQRGQNVPEIMKAHVGRVNAGAIVPSMQPIAQRPSTTPSKGSGEAKKK